MGLKDWLARKVLEYQTGQATSPTDAVDWALKEKAEKLRKAGKLVDRESLLAGYKALAVLGVTKEMVEARIEILLQTPV